MKVTEAEKSKLWVKNSTRETLRGWKRKMWIGMICVQMNNERFDAEECENVIEPGTYRSRWSFLLSLTHNAFATILSEDLKLYYRINGNGYKKNCLPNNRNLQGATERQRERERAKKTVRIISSIIHSNDVQRTNANVCSSSSKFIIAKWMYKHEFVEFE